MGLEFNPLVVIGAAALCCSIVAFVVARRTVTSGIVVDTRNRPGYATSQQKPELSDLIVIPLRKEVTWKNLQVSPALVIFVTCHRKLNERML